MIRECLCSKEKSHKATFDGGDLGNYTVKLCEECFLEIGSKWMINDENLIK